MHSQPPTVLLQTLRRAASLLASRPHLLRPPEGAAAVAASAAQQQQRSLAAAASAAATTTPAPADKATTTATTATTSTPSSLLPPHVDQAYLAAARARVFDHAPPAPATGPGAGGRRSGRRPLLEPLRGRELNSWYVTADREVPLLENQEESARLERVALRRSSGRAPPKKGQGKRASGGKKKK
jgi:hypothetical protein